MHFGEHYIGIWTTSSLSVFINKLSEDKLKISIMLLGPLIALFQFPPENCVNKLANCYLAWLLM